MRSRKLIPLLVLCVVSAAWYGLDWGEDEEWIARVEESVITVDDYRVAFFEYITNSGLPDTPRRRADFLERLISMRLLSESARIDGRFNHDVLLRDIERVRQKLSIEGFLHREVYDRIRITESDLQNMFTRVNTQLSASHLFASSLDEANTLKDRLNSGESFESLAEEVFKSEELRSNGGSVGEFGFDEMDSAFEDAAYVLEVGQISDPVRTAQGYSIIRLDSRFTNPILTEQQFAEKRAGLSRYVETRKRNAARKMLHAEILETSQLELDEIVLGRLFETLSGSDYSFLTEQSVLTDRLPSVSPDDVLIRAQTGDFTIAEFIGLAEFTSQHQREAVVTLDALTSFARGLFARKLLLERATRAGIDRSPAFNTAMRREKYDLFYERAWSNLEDQIVIPLDSIEAHLNRFADEFMVSESARVREILVGDRTEAFELRSLLTPSNFADLAAARSIRPGARATGGDLGYVTREQLGVLAQPVFNASVSQIIGPYEIGGRYVFLLIEDKLASRPATLAEARPRVEQQLKSYWIRARVREEAAALRNRFKIETRAGLLATLDLRESASTGGAS